MLKEKWASLPYIAGECSLSRIEYDSTNLLVELDSFLENRTIKICFENIFSYRVTLEHFRWANFRYTPQTSSTLIKVENSNYIKWLEEAGVKLLYDSTLDISHYMLQTTEHIIDVALLAESSISIDGNII
uniref:EAL domain-containing protein n=1 Tax=Prevotella sp. GTC17254 TaxID=3236794 RepID=A0AB33IRU1_9BACT